MADKGLATDNEIQAALAELPGWKRQNNSLQKTFDLKGFKAAMAFTGTVGELADRTDHHPDILIQYSKVTVTLWSHDKGGATDGDPRQARQIDAAAKHHPTQYAAAHRAPARASRHDPTHPHR